MADPAAEKTLEAGGKTYRVYYGNRAFRLVELELGKPLLRINASSIHEITVMVWAGLQQYHPELKLEDIDAIIDEAGYAVVDALCTEAIEMAIGRYAQADAGNGTAPGNGAAPNRAARRRAGTGGAS